MQLLTTARDYLLNRIWELDVSTLPPWHARSIGALRVVYLIGRDLATGELNMRAMSLVYTSLLALVPLLAVSFSVLKGFGVHNQLEPILLNFLAPMGDRGAHITQQIIGFVENVKAGVLGSVGLVLLIYTVISLTQKIERAFNFTWRVTENRSMARRFSDYFSVILLGPLLIFAAITMTATVTGSSIYAQLEQTMVIGHLLQTVNTLLPYVLVIMAFTLIYILVPNTKVHFRSALVGALVTGILWQTVGWGFAEFVTSSTRTIAIYSAFATLFMFIIWLYLSWLILLIGASIAYYHQFPERRTRLSRQILLSNRLKEKLALSIMVLVARRFFHQEKEWTMVELSQHLKIAEDAVHAILNTLVQQQLLVRTDHEPPRFVPGQAIERISLLHIVEAIRQADEDVSINMQRMPGDSVIDSAFDDYQDAAAQHLQARSLRDLIVESEQH